MRRCRAKHFCLTAAVVVFWLVMMSALLLQQTSFRFRPSAYQALLSKDTLFTDQWLGIYFAGAPVGFMNTGFEPCIIRPGVSGYRITNRTFLTVYLLGQQTKISFASSAVIDENYQLEHFEADFYSGAHRLRTRGERQGRDHLAVTIDSHGAITSRLVPVSREDGLIIATMMSPFQSFGRMEVGACYEVNVLNPFTFEIEPLRITVEGQDVITLAAESQNAFVLRSEYMGIEQRSWVSHNGELLKQQTVMGWEIIKEDSSIALRVYEQAGRTDEELLDMVSIPVVLPIPPERIRRLSVGLEGISRDFLITNHRQKMTDYDPERRKAVIVIAQEVPPREPLALPITRFPEYLAASALIQADDSGIKDIAAEIIAASADSWQAAIALNRWVFETIKKKPVVSIPSAIDVLNTREGDCNEHTALFTALARAVGIPTRMHVGLAYTQGRFFYHAWPSVFVGEWIDMDPTFGQDIADAAHLTLIEGDISKQMAIIQLLGNISLEVVNVQ